MLRSPKTLEETLPPHHSLAGCIGSGAVWGALAWAAYACVEAFFAELAPRLLPEGYMRPASNAEFTAFVFAVYLAAGAASGAVLGLAAWLLARWQPFGFRPTRSFLPSCAALSVTAALTLHLSRPFTRDGVGAAALLLSVVFFILQASSALSDRWAQRMAFLANPWGSSAAVLGCLWVTWMFFGQSDPWLRNGVAAACFLAVALVSLAWWILWRRLKVVASRNPAAEVVLTTLVAGAVLSATFLPPASARLDNLSPGGTASATKRPNVVIVVWDTVRADHLSVYGYTRDTTPFLREFAGQATLYQRAWSTGAMTLTSHASMFTGLYGFTHGARPADPAEHPKGDYGAPLADRHSTLAEVLSGAGYATAAVVANHAYLSEAYNLHQGFAYYEVPTPFWAKHRPFFLRQPLRTTLVRSFAPWEAFRESSPAGEINQTALDLLGRFARARRPFFLFLNYLDAHDLILPPSPFDTLFPASTSLGMDAAALWSDVVGLRRPLTPAERADLIAYYDAAIAYLDSALRDLVKRLRELGLYDDTMIIVTSDHGQAFGSRGHLFHIMSVYNNQTRIPLLIKYPGQRQGAAVEQPASLVDIFPTVLDTAGLPLPAPVEGLSLRRPEAAAPRTLLAESYPNAFLVQLHPRFRRVERAAIRWPYKLIADTRGKRELYDLESDPAETRNLYAAHPTIAASLLAELERRVASRQRAPARPPDPETLRRLRSLGYTQ
ncbi:MAG TPA: sulfatase-like hydrolase/transferase [Bryobacteraceae bacterium]|nr:sulfatase-like hydrolase/transferase [Bryobacteraceae bacterium]